MTIFSLYALLFAGTNIGGVGFLSYLQTVFLQGKSFGSWVDSLPRTMGVTAVLIAIVLVLAYRVLHPLDMVVAKVKSGNYEPTEDDKKTLLSINKKINRVTVIASLIAYLIGNTVSVILSSNLPKTNPKGFALAIVHAVIGCAASLLPTMYIFDINLVKYREYFKIRRIHHEDRSSKISMTLAQMSITMVFYIGFNVFLVPYQLIHNADNPIPLHSADYYTMHTFLVLFLSILYLGSTVWVLLRGIRTRLQYNTFIIQDAARKGDLSVRIDLSIMDDLGYLTSNINELLEAVSQSMTTFKNESGEVASSANVLSTAAESSAAAVSQMSAAFDKISAESKNQYKLISDVSGNVSSLSTSATDIEKYMIEQSSAMQENAASMTQMASNINSVAQLTKKADMLSTTLTETSDNGNEMIRQAIKAIAEIQESSKEVQEMTKIIQNIASQTNLLSMNAAIEAAHAGEYGTGFAVVADEVRSLATSSAKSAKDIQNYIKEMAAKIEGGVHTITAAGEAFKKISMGVGENQELMRTISNAMEEQRIGAAEMLEVTTSVSEALVQANELVQSQTKHVALVNSAMDNVVKSSAEVNTVIADGSVAGLNLQDAVNKVSSIVETNKASVKRMEDKINVFTF